MKIMNNRRILFLDYMRVIAFSLVVLGHKFNKDLSLNRPGNPGD